MNRKLTGLAIAGVSALVGTLLLVGYVRSAEARALSGEELVDVLVVTEAIAAGTPAEEIAGNVVTEQVPAKVRADGAITDLDDLDGKVATVDLLPGEQLVVERFAAEAARVGVPDGLLEVTVRLDPERAVGGTIRAGDKVAVFSSFDPFEIDASGTGAGGEGPKKTPNTTHLILHKVIVTNVQTATPVTQPKDEGDGDGDPFALAPTGNLLVTLALDADDAQRVLFTAEHGMLWLSAEPSGAPEPDLGIETLGTVNR